jgi:hypothetical protein
MPLTVLETIVRRWSSIVDRIFVRRAVDRNLFGPLLIDRGRGFLYDVERDLTWLQDTNYAKTNGHSRDGQMTWYDAKAWVARLNYRGVTGWRLPNSLNEDGTGPCIGDNCSGSELGHLVFTAMARKSPGLRLVNWDPSSIYWCSTEASATEAFAFQMTGLKQGTLAKDPWAADPNLGGAVPIIGVVRTWPVHDGDVASSFFVRFIDAIFSPFTRASA